MQKKTRTFFLSCLVLLATAVLPAHAEPLPVFVSIAPQKWLIEQIGGDRVKTQVLLDKGQEPHTYQPSPDKMTALFRSRLYFTLGMPFERVIARKIESSQTRDAALQLIDITTDIKRITIAVHHHNNDEKKEIHGHTEKEHSKEHADPHVWLDPRNLALMASVITETLAATDPEHTITYQQNLKALKEKLFQLHHGLQQQLAPFRGATFFVFHPAFGYFAHAYGLHQEAVEIEGKAPSPKQLYTLVQQAKKDKVKVLFVQPQFDRRNAQAVAQAIKGKLVILDPLAENIEQNLRNMGEAVQAALTP